MRLIVSKTNISLPGVELLDPVVTPQLAIFSSVKKIRAGVKTALCGGEVGSIKADAGVALRVNNNELISPQSEQAVCLPPSGIHQAGAPALFHSSLQ